MAPRGSRIVAIDDDPALLILYRELCRDEGLPFFGVTHADWRVDVLEDGPALLVVDPVDAYGDVTWRWLEDIVALPTHAFVLVSSLVTSNEIAPFDLFPTAFRAEAESRLRGQLSKPFEIDDLIRMLHSDTPPGASTHGSQAA